MIGQIKTLTRVYGDEKDDRRKSGIVRKAGGALRYGDRCGDDVWVAVFVLAIAALGFFAIAAWGPLWAK